MTTPIVTSITDEQLAEIESSASKVTAMHLDSAEVKVKSDGAMIECPICGGEGYASLENDYCNFDGHAIGVQFYGIGPEFGAGEEYFRAASPQRIQALITRLRAAEKDADRYRFLCDPGDADEDCLAHAINTLNDWADKSDIDQAIDAAMEQSK